MKTSTLGLIQQLIGALEGEGIDYCHWKSNDALAQTLAGDTDLDLLIDPRHKFKFSRQLVRLGFKKARGRKDARYPGIVHFYGYDLESEKTVDVHAHFRLIAGADLLKNYELPLAGPLIESARDVEGLKTPSLHLEYIVFVIRMVLKRRLLAWIFGRPDPRFHLKAFSRSGRPGLEGTEAQEWESFQSHLNRQQIAEALAVHLPEVDIRLFESCEASLRPQAPRWAWLTAGLRLARALKAYQRFSTPVATVRAALRSAENLIGVFRLRFRGTEYRSRPRLAAGGSLVAFIGGDGSGKTTNLEALSEWLGRTFDVRTFHLGKPPVGPTRLSYILISKAIRLLMGDPREANVKPLHAITHILVARGRWKLASEAASQVEAGVVVLSDRYPIAALKSAEAPFIPNMEASESRLVSWLERIEQKYYDRIGALRPPDHLIVLDVDPQVAIDRKPEDHPDFIRPRLEEIRAVNWEEVPGASVVDTAQPLERVLEEIRHVVWNALPGWSPQVEIAGVAGAGKTTLIAELVGAGLCEVHPVEPSSHRLRVLKHLPTLWWTLWRMPPGRVRALAVKLSTFDFWEGRNGLSRRPVIYDHGPFYSNAHTLWLFAGNLRSRRLRAWHLNQIERASDILDLVIQLEADDALIRDRINSRSQAHVIKDGSPDIQGRFLGQYRQYLDSVRSGRQGREAFCVTEFRTDDLSPADLVGKVTGILS